MPRLFEWILMFASVAIIRGQNQPHCNGARAAGYKCYKELFTTTVHPTKMQFVQEAFTDPLFGRGLVGYWEDMVLAFQKCRKFEPEYDACAGPAPTIPTLFEHDLPLFAKARFDCMLETQKDIRVNASMEVFQNDAENCFQDEITEELCMPNDVVIYCMGRELGKLRRNRSFDKASQMLTKVKQDIEKHFRTTEPLYGPCSDCFRHVGMECMPQPRTDLIYQRKELQQIACISAYKTKQMRIFNNIFASCMTEKGFDATPDIPHIPSPHKWASICSFGDTMLKNDFLDGDL